MKNKIDNQIMKIFRKSLEIKSSEFNINANKKNLIMWDSMANVALISNIEKKYKIKFNNNEINKLDSLKKLIKIVKKKYKS
jgi:acyl carrier protein